MAAGTTRCTRSASASGSASKGTRAASHAADGPRTERRTANRRPQTEEMRRMRYSVRMHRRTLFSLASALALGFGLLQAAQPPARPAAAARAPMAAPMAAVDPALFKGLKYRLVGPSRGGRVTTVTGVPS